MPELEIGVSSPGAQETNGQLNSILQKLVTIRSLSSRLGGLGSMGRGMYPGGGGLGYPVGGTGTSVASTSAISTAANKMMDFTKGVSPGRFEPKNPGEAWQLGATTGNNTLIGIASSTRRGWQDIPGGNGAMLRRRGVNKAAPVIAGARARAVSKGIQQGAIQSAMFRTLLRRFPTVAGIGGIAGRGVSMVARGIKVGSVVGLTFEAGRLALGTPERIFKDNIRTSEYWSDISPLMSASTKPAARRQGWANTPPMGGMQQTLYNMGIHAVRGDMAGVNMVSSIEDVVNKREHPALSRHLSRILYANDKISRTAVEETLLNAQYFKDADEVRAVATQAALLGPQYADKYIHAQAGFRSCGKWYKAPKTRPVVSRVLAGG